MHALLTEGLQAVRSDFGVHTAVGEYCLSSEIFDASNALCRQDMAYFGERFGRLGVGPSHINKRVPGLPCPSSGGRVPPSALTHH